MLASPSNSYLYSNKRISNNKDLNNKNLDNKSSDNKKLRGWPSCHIMTLGHPLKCVLFAYIFSIYPI